jgi:hypothetical protein
VQVKTRRYTVLLSSKTIQYYEKTTSDSLTDSIDPDTGQFLPGRDEPLGIVDLKSVYRVEPLQESGADAAFIAEFVDEHGFRGDWGFLVHTIERKWSFFAGTETERALWMMHIADLVKPLPLSRFEVRAENSLCYFLRMHFLE